MKVFVYGSLMKGFGNHDLISSQRRPIDDSFFGSGKAFGNFEMISFKYYPGAYKVEDGLPIHGELYEVDDSTFYKLDHLESNGSFYQRELVDVSTNHAGHNYSGPAWIYLLMKKPNSCDIVENNDWKSHLENEYNSTERTKSCAS